jgi:hypothetical protein
MMEVSDQLHVPADSTPDKFSLCSFKRIVFLDFIHRLVFQEQTKLKIIIDKR